MKLKKEKYLYTLILIRRMNQAASAVAIAPANQVAKKNALVVVVATANKPKIVALSFTEDFNIISV